MPISRYNQRTFHLHLYGSPGMLQTITLLKRGDDQQEGTVTSIVLFQCRRSAIHKTGEAIAGDMLSNHRTVFHIPRIELDRVGIQYITPLDRIVERWKNSPPSTRTWQPEATTMIDVKLMETHLCLACLLLKSDPNPYAPGGG